MPSVEEELFLADTQQARHQRVKRLCGEHLVFRSPSSHTALLQQLHIDLKIG